MIAILLTPLARYAFIVLAILAVAGGLYGKGRHDGRVSAESRIAAAVAAEQLRQAAVRAKALDNAASRELAARADANALSDKVDAYERELANASADASRGAPTPPGSCPPRFKLGADDVRDLGVFQH